VIGTASAAALPTAVMACRNGIVRSAASYGAVSVDAFSAGTLWATQGGGQIAPLTVRIAYPGEVREAKVECHLDARGTVTAVKSA
jgi:hypothetical protein